jgi:hypothetical protein
MGVRITSMMPSMAGSRAFEDAETGHRAGVVVGVLPRHFPDAPAPIESHVTCSGCEGRGPLDAQRFGPQVLVKVERPQRSEDERP